MVKALVVNMDNVNPFRKPIITNPKNYTVIHAVKAAQARKAQKAGPAKFNPIRGLDKLKGGR